MIASLLQIMLERQSDRVGSFCVTFLNPYSYLVARRNVELFKNFDIIHYDGIALSVAMRLLGVSKPRISFDMTSLADEVFKNASKENKTIYLVGGQDGVAGAAARIIASKYQGINIIGSRGGFFLNEDARGAFIDGMVDCRPDIIIVGMGTPLQEDFLVDIKKRGWEGNGYTCGGFLHQTASRGIQYYPKWANRYHLRWLYRMIDEPKLIVRFIRNYPLFVIIFTFDVIKFYLNKSRS
jgi:N-acetylglucosaminyldiphosphoundecaprenol N-acetyl-beta-D-mannosaminyltransferase